MEFQWNPDKADENPRKHDVAFEIATRVFTDPFHFEIKEEDHAGELRYSEVGMVDGRLLHVTYTMRGEVYWIISARAAEPYERRRYHEI